METRAAVKVGLFAILAFVILTAAYVILNHQLADWKRFDLVVNFTDTKGLAAQTPVRMSGVNIGEVKSIELVDDASGRLHPRVILAIDRKFLHRIPRDSQISVASGLLINNAQVQITPGISPVTFGPDETWPRMAVTNAPGMLSQISPEADQTIKRMAAVLEVITPQLGRTMKHVEGIMKRADHITEHIENMSISAETVLHDPRISRTLNGSLDDIAAITKETRITTKEITHDLKQIFKRNGTKFDDLANTAVDTLQKLGDTVDAARSAVTRLTEQVSDPRLQQSLIETLDLARSTVARFNQIASDIHQLTGDQANQANIRDTIANVKSIGDKFNDIGTRLTHLVDRVDKAHVRSPSVGPLEPSVDILGRGSAPHIRTDVNVRLNLNAHSALDLGIRDFTGQNNLDAQWVNKLERGGDLRLGIYNAKIGVGADFPSGHGPHVRVDLYDPNSIKLDARALLPINPHVGLWFGADNLLSRPTPLAGVQIRP